MKKLISFTFTFIFTFVLMPVCFAAQSDEQTLSDTPNKDITDAAKSSSTSLPEDTYKLGVAAFKGADGQERDYRAAFTYFADAAKAGNAKGYIMLGIYSDAGIVVRQKPEIAFMRYKAAADMGNPVALFNTATMYLSGEGIEPDAKEAARLFALAADKGHAEAAYNLGVMYYKGLGIKADMGKSKEWFDKSAQLGNPTAAFAYKSGGNITLYKRSFEVPN